MPYIGRSDSWSTRRRVSARRPLHRDPAELGGELLRRAGAHGVLLARRDPGHQRPLARGVHAAPDHAPGLLGPRRCGGRGHRAGVSMDGAQAAVAAGAPRGVPRARPPLRSGAARARRRLGARRAAVSGGHARQLGPRGQHRGVWADPRAPRWTLWPWTASSLVLGLVLGLLTLATGNLGPPWSRIS